jgi:hypothetical protein
MSNKISSSPDRHTFQKESYIKRCKEYGEEPNPDYVKMYDSWQEQAAEQILDSAWQKDNMEYDLRSTDWILEKVRTSDSYAQNLYAAMCNMQFQKIDVWPILKNERWSASWRYAGGIVADMCGKGDYMDWYCSGIQGEISEEELAKMSVEQQERHHWYKKNFVGEGVVTDEIREDLKKLGWTPVEWEDN